jgi:hypothetical protein
VSPQDVEAAKINSIKESCRIDTKYLLETYLSKEAPSEVNISASLKNRITTLIDITNSCSSSGKQLELMESLVNAQAEIKVKYF